MTALIENLDTDHEGYLKRQSDWTEALAVELASADGIELSEAHWEVMHFLQEYYEKYDIAPAIRILTKQMGKRFGKEKGNSKYLYELFPKGPAKQACRYAGLPKPTGCVRTPLNIVESLFAWSFSLAWLWWISAMVFRLWQWASTPSPLPIPLSPAPRTRAGVVWRLLLETLLFRALARGDKITWGLSLLFHYGLLLVVLMHLRFLLPVLPAFMIPLLFVLSLIHI